ncbi:hypothetical protein ACDF64_04725 [Agromyces sp. MMS24-JH15]|uniref:hypothetical protein n=1 Tax=Agromyces sp. MMS24-JH15 TaxID=3243765 RepID=UPI00374A67DF
MGYGLEDLAGLLNMHPPIAEAWFEQTEAVVGFAPQKPSSMRPIILRHWAPSGPLAFVFARTSNLDRLEVRNPRHDHVSVWGKCRLHEEGNIIVSRPLPVPRDALDENHRMCSEEDQDTIDAVKSAPWKTK